MWAEDSPEGHITRGSKLVGPGGKSVKGYQTLAADGNEKDASSYVDSHDMCDNVVSYGSDDGKYLPAVDIQEHGLVDIAVVAPPAEEPVFWGHGNVSGNRANITRTHIVNYSSKKRPSVNRRKDVYETRKTTTACGTKYVTITNL